MAKVSTRTPPLISLYFCQERGDPDYGSCLWAVFNFDLERYELSITSDCGNYAYGWVPTHKSESFMNTYLTIMVTILVLTQIVRIIQNTIQLRRQYKLFQAQLGQLDDITQEDLDMQRRAYRLIVDHFERKGSEA